MPLSTSKSDPEERSMSSGDESDNEDLTDAETSDSDWFDSGKSLSASSICMVIELFQKDSRMI